MNNAVMIQGTASDVGKSLVVAGLCRAARRRSLRGALQAGEPVEQRGRHRGRRQIGRAQALRPSPRDSRRTDMNPVLLKPEADAGLQVIVHGRRRTGAALADRERSTAELLAAVMESFERLRASHDLVVVEGAGARRGQPAGARHREHGLRHPRRSPWSGRGHRARWGHRAARRDPRRARARRSRAGARVHREQVHRPAPLRRGTTDRSPHGVARSRRAPLVRGRMAPALGGRGRPREDGARRGVPRRLSRALAHLQRRRSRSARVRAGRAPHDARSGQARASGRRPRVDPGDESPGTSRSCAQGGTWTSRLTIGGGASRHLRRLPDARPRRRPRGSRGRPARPRGWVCST